MFQCQDVRRGVIRKLYSFCFVSLPVSSSCPDIDTSSLMMLEGDVKRCIKEKGHLKELKKKEGSVYEGRYSLFFFKKIGLFKDK